MDIKAFHHLSHIASGIISHTRYHIHIARSIFTTSIHILKGVHFLTWFNCIAIHHIAHNQECDGIFSRNSLAVSIGIY